MGFEKRKVVGLTLLFVEDDGETRSGVLKSYIRLCTSAAQARKLARCLGKDEELRPRQTTLQFLGLADIFDVSGPPQHGSLLSRTTRDDWRSPNDVQRASKIGAREMPARREATRTTHLVELGFMSQGTPYGNCGVVALSVIVAREAKEALAVAELLGRSADFIRKLSQAGSPDEDASGISFVGVLDIADTPENPLEGGAFEVLDRPIDKDWVPDDELLHEDDLEGYFRGS